MALADSYGNKISTASKNARDHYDRGLWLFLGADFGALNAFRQSVEEDPGFALGHAALARAAMMAGDMKQAKEAILRAQGLVNDASARERQHTEAISLLISGKPKNARLVVLDHVKAYPRDALAAQLCSNVFGLIGFSGEVGREADLLAYTSALLPHYGEDWWMMSMHALSLCETGQIEQSASLMEKSIALNPRNANAAHFKAHAQYEAGETAAGRDYLQQWIVDYDDRSMMHSHLTWHLALWALGEGDEASMWQMVDAGVAPGASKGLPINILTDTAAILYRAELAGISVDPGRWSALSDYAAQLFPETGQSFIDMHAALSHAMAGEGERLAYIAETAKGFAGDLVKPVARAWGAIAREDWSGALEELIHVMGTTERLGGSRAQRDLLELAYVNVLLKLGKIDEAYRSLSIRRPVLATSPPVAGLQ